MASDPRPLLGRRVSLRYRVPGGGTRQLRTDAVGELDHDGTRWVVHTAKGRVGVDPADVVAVRPVPPRPPRRGPLAAVAELERVCATAWPAPVCEPLGEWLLHAGAPFDLRTSSALVAGDPGMPVADALAEVARFAAAHEQPPRVQVPRSTPWQARVERAGWVPAPHAPLSVRSGPLAGLAADHAGIEILDTPTAAWWQRAAGAAQPDDATRAVLAGGRIGYGLARCGDEVVGVLRAALVDGWLHLARLAVDPAWRRSGFGRALARAAVSWGQEHHAGQIVTQVVVGDDAAERLCDSLGLSEHHSCAYWAPNSSEAGRAGPAAGM